MESESEKAIRHKRLQKVYFANDPKGQDGAFRDFRPRCSSIASERLLQKQYARKAARGSDESSTQSMGQPLTGAPNPTYATRAGTCCRWLEDRLQPFRKKEAVFCLIGGVTLIIGVILIIISLANSHGVFCDCAMAARSCKADFTKNVYIYPTSSNISERDTQHQEKTVDQVSPTMSTTTRRRPTIRPTVTNTNLALGKPSTQSTTQYSSELAVDGNTTGDAGLGLCAQTEPEERPHWFVDLGPKKYLVSTVVIHSRTDCCQYDLKNFEIRLWSNTPNFNKKSNSIICKHYMGAATRTTLHVSCDRQVYGRFVSIELLQEENDIVSKQNLTLCEVGVYR
ncbi:unnamed protein product [Owenia fusiformis]|uniref:Uncharacterized protein n=1 Tax=Owenia fusiformis TaxID=6347 RepID=A0A8J1YBJ1_OWEFU|nr:unnamed protein product [Owenia fusiformis]